MNSKIAIVVSIFAAGLMLLPGMSMASPIQSNVHQYQVGNEKVIFNGKQVFISFGKGTDRVKWQVMEITHTGFKKVHFSNYHVKRIETGNQNSAVLILNNSFVRMAEIFSFQKHSIDASVAVKNLRRYNVTLEVIFSMSTIQDSKIHFNGAAPGNNFNLGNGQMKVIPSTAWSTSLGALEVNWMGSYSLLHFGSVARNNSKDFITLPFGPLSLISNETFSIDPVITPMIIPIPPGGGGGGSGPTAPTVSSESVSQTYVGPGQSTSLSAYVNTGGAATVYFEFYQFGTWDSAFSEYETASTTYSHTFSYSQLSENQVTALRVMATNSAGTSYGLPRTINVYYYAPVSQSFSAYNSSGGQVATVTLGITVPGWSGSFNTLGPAASGTPNYFNMNFGTAAEWNKNDVGGVWNITQNIQGYSTNFQGTGQVFGLGTVRYAEQSVSNETFLVNLADYIVGIANAFAFNIIPSPSYFVNSGGTSTPIDVSSYSPPEDSSAPAYISTGCGCGMGYFYYPPIQYGSLFSTHTSKIWGVKSVSDYFSNGNIPDYLGIIKYSANVNFVTANDDYTLHTYGISATLTIGVNVQTIGG